MSRSRLESRHGLGAIELGASLAVESNQARKEMVVPLPDCFELQGRSVDELVLVLDAIAKSPRARPATVWS